MKDALIWGDELHVRDCIIIATGSVRYGISLGGPPGAVENVTLIGKMPSLWGLIKLWWRYRRSGEITDYAFQER